MAAKKKAAKTKLKGPVVIGAMPAAAAFKKLSIIKDPYAPLVKRKVEKVGPRKSLESLFLRTDKKVPAYQHTEHQYGFFPIAEQNPQPTTDIADAAAMDGDETLKGQRLRITLDRLRVFDYPGKGEHTVLVDFSARHVTDAALEELRFSQQYRALEGTGAGVRGFPVFVGLRVGSEGIALQCFTINVENKDDKKILSFLEAPIFKRGLELINTVNPVLPVVTGFVTGISEAFAKRNENVAVQNFYLGLDFTRVQSRARLREGTYVCVQAPEADWDWSRWQWDRRRGVIESKATPKTAIPFNYLVIGVSRMA